MYPTVLTVAGSDSSGGAGIQADLKAIAANGGYGASAVVAITAQNTHGVRAACAVALDLVRAQIDAVFEDLDVAACKTGMLADDAVIETVAEALRRHRPRHMVCDPVMISKTGFALLSETGVGALVARLLPLTTLVTPNVHEARALSGIEVRTADDAERAGRAILERGPAAVLVKGGHLEDGTATDVLVTPRGTRRFPGERLDSPHTHGTGCTYSAAIATQLALGAPLEEAVGLAKRFVTAAIRHGLAVGSGVGPTDPFFLFRDGSEAAAWLDRVRTVRRR